MSSVFGNYVFPLSRFSILRLSSNAGQNISQTRNLFQNEFLRPFPFYLPLQREIKNGTPDHQKLKDCPCLTDSCVM